MQTAKKFSHRVLAVILSALMLFSVMPIASLQAFAASTGNVSNSGEMKFWAPEAIYLVPNASSSTSSTASNFQYYINNDTNGSPVETAATTGKIYYSYAKASNASISWRFVSSDMLTAYSTGSITLSTTSPGTSAEINITSGTSPSLAAGETGCYIEWTLSYTDTGDNNTAKKVYAYTYVYKPYTIPVFAAARAYNGTGVEAESQTITWVVGVNGCTNAGDRVYNATNFNPMFGTIKTPTNTKNDGGYYQDDNTYHSSSSNGGTGKFVNYKAGSATSNQGNVQGQSVSPKGLLSVDTSRYTNYKNIPNLRIGLLLSCCNEGSATTNGRWFRYYLSDYTSLYGTLGEATTSSGNDSSYVVTNFGSPFFADYYHDSDNGDNRSREECRPRLIYNGVWDNTVASSNKTIAIKGAVRFGVKKKSNSRNSTANTSNIVGVDLKVYNKATLRTAVENAIKAMPVLGVNGMSETGKPTSCYFDADANYKWTTFQTEFQKAVRLLGSVDMTTGITDTPDQVATKLNNAIANLCTKVTFNGNGGSLSGSTTKYIKIGTAKTITVTPADEGVTANTRTGYDFLGWSKDSSATTGSSSVTVAYNETIYAIWKIHTSTLKVDPAGGTWNGSTSAQTFTQNYNTTKAIPLPTRTGYTFKGWTKSASFNGSLPSTTAATTYTFGAANGVTDTITATWEINKYDITFDCNDSGRQGTAQCSETVRNVTYNSTLAALPVPTLDGYTFDGWYTAASGGTKFTKTVYDLTDPITLYAHWTAITYSASFNVNGGSAVSDFNYNVESTATLPSTYKTGYTFKGWKVTSGEGSWVVNSTHEIGEHIMGTWGNVSFEAVWEADSYELVFDLNCADRVGTPVYTGPDSMTVTYDSSVTITDPSLTGYVFDGWYTSTNVKITSTNAWKYTDGMTLYAHWTPVTYTATFIPNNGGTQTSIDYTIESNFNFPVIQKKGYTFKVWGNSASIGNWTAGAEYQSGQVSPDRKYGNVTFGATWNANNYLITFDLNDGTTASPAECSQTVKTVTFDSAVGELPVPTRTGYTFDGWYTAPTGGTEVTAATVYNYVPGNAGDNLDSTLYAHWTVIEYTITFNVRQGTPIAPLTYTIEDDLVLPEASMAGFDFTMWIYLGATTGSWHQNDTIAKNALDLGTGNYGNVLLTANYEVKTYTITWIINDVTETQTYNYNAVPTHADPADVEDAMYTYEFVGWTPYITYVTEDATYTAVFNKTAKQYVITWENEDGTVAHQETIAYGDPVPSKPVPTKTGYTGEWDNVPATMPAENYTVKPVYTPINYTITWIVNGTTTTSQAPYDSIPVYPGTTPSKAADAEYTYTFSGWSPALTTVKHDSTYTAEFTSVPNVYTITWVADGNTVRTDSVAFGTAITSIPAIPKKPGYSAEWLNIPLTMPAQNITINAQYTYGARTVTWMINGEGYETVVMDGAYPSYNLSTPTKPSTAEYYYVFEGWSATENGSIIATFPAVNGSDVTYYAVFSQHARSYTVTWMADGTAVYTEVVVYGTAVPSKTVPSKVGHTGVWADAPSTMPARDVTITAVYNPIKYNITWVVNGTSTTDRVAYGTMPSFTGSTAKPSSATTDYTFTGWDPQVVTVTGNATYTAQYAESARKYTVKWVAEGVTVATQTVAYGVAVPTDIDVPAKTGHTAVWGAYPATMPAGDLTITAVYTPIDYTVTWVTPTGTTTSTWAYGTTPSYVGATPVKPATAEVRYEFAGWNPLVTAVTGDVTYTAVFAEYGREYIVTWMADGVVVSTASVAFGSSIPNPEVPSKEGYNGMWNNIYTKMPAKDITINATYIPVNYTVYWRVNGITQYAESYAYGQPIAQRPVPELEGHTGVWDNIPATMPAHNVVINAVYTVNEYQVTWRAGEHNGTDKATYGVNYEMTFDLPELPESIRVVVGGNALATSAYSYDNTTGKIVIIGRYILGDITIIGRAIGGQIPVIISIDNGTGTNVTEMIPIGMAYHTDIIAPEGYLLPETVVIYIDGVRLTKGYTYDEETGKLTINGEVITGELQIVADCTPDPAYVPPEEDPDAPSGGSHTSFLDSISNFFERIINFFRKIFGIAK